MKVLFLAAEATPLAKVGGLADVAGELPPVLNEIGADVRLAIPFHAPIHALDLPLERIADVEIPHIHGSERAFLYQTPVRQHPIYLIDGDPIRAVEKIYSTPETDGHKFTFFSLAALKGMQALDWKPDLLHANDWHTAAAIAWMSARRRQDPFWENVATLLTIHNLPYMGAGGEAALAHYGLPASEDLRLPEWARALPLPLGLAAADWISAVSPSYAGEIQAPQFGHGLEALLFARRERLVGILNGIDPRDWDPQTDQALIEGYSRSNLTSRRANKSHLQIELDLPQTARVPLIGMVTRLDWQKGVDIALEALRELIDVSWQFALLGSGDAQLEGHSQAFADMYPDRVRYMQRFDPRLARQIYGGADMLLIPSRYEPCGLTQMIAMRYGCVPVVSSTGGLRDTVHDCGSHKDGTGFVFQPTEAQAMAQSLLRAFLTYADQRRWRGIQLRGMAQDFSWENSARKYLQLYARAIRERGNA